MIAETGPSRSLIEAITERERELGQLTHELETVKRSSAESHPGSIRDFVKTGLKNLLTLLRAERTTRAELAKYTSEIRMNPEIAASGELCYVAEGDWSLFGGSDFAMVAGEGFEPSTFGL